MEFWYKAVGVRATARQENIGSGLGGFGIQSFGVNCGPRLEDWGCGRLYSCHTVLLRTSSAE